MRGRIPYAAAQASAGSPASARGDAPDVRVAVAVSFLPPVGSALKEESPFPSGA